MNEKSILANLNELDDKEGFKELRDLLADIIEPR